MATTFDRYEFIRALRDKTALDERTVEALADALHDQQDKADLVTRRDLDAVKQEILNKGLIGFIALGTVLIAAMSALKVFA